MSIPPPSARSAREQAGLLVCGAFLVGAVYFAVAAFQSPSGQLPPAQPDTLMYMQYARSMAEGHPYEFTPGDARSTGSTSHLYPFLLSLLYRAGARGGALVTAGFVLNVLFYVLFVVFSWIAARKLAPGAAGAAILLVLLNGHLSSTALGQTDIGLFMAVSAGALAAVAWGRPVLAAVALPLCVWSRPEGVILGAVLLGAGVAARVRRDDSARVLLVSGFAGVVSAVLLFAFNAWLTGHWQFQSVTGKGHFATHPLGGAMIRTVRDFGTIVGEVLFNVPGNARQSYFLPIAGGVLALLGIASLDWRGGGPRWVLGWWLVSCLASLGLIATSGWQFLNLDRYMGWLLPAWYLCAAVGAGAAAEALGRPGARRLLVVLLAGYELVCLPFFVGTYASSCMFTQTRAAFCRTVHAQLPADQRIGVFSGTGMQYYMPGRRLLHVAGISSPAFSGARHVLCNVERLKHRPDLRFEYWMTSESQRGAEFPPALFGAEMLADLDAVGDPSAMALNRADWATLDGVADGPLQPDVRRAISGLRLVDSVDVGFPDDERRCSYRVDERLLQTRTRPYAATAELGGRPVTEVGQPVIGSDSFVVRVEPGKSVRLVMRTALAATGSVARVDMTLQPQGFHFVSPLRLRPIVAGQVLPDVSLDLGASEAVFSEVMIEIPAESVTSGSLPVTLAGDHIALAYWFYQ